MAEFTPVSFNRHKEKTFVIIGVDNIHSNDKARDELIQTLEIVAEKFDDKNFGFLYGDAEKLKRGIEGAGASGTVFPTILAINSETNSQFVFDENIDFSVENISHWLNGLLDGTAESFKKSQPIPEENNDIVKLLVAKTFHFIDGKDSLVLYYAPWCPHCKALLPVFDQLAHNFADKNIFFAKIDPTENYHEEEITEIPTVVWYSSNGKEKQRYSGDRTLNDLTVFVNNQLKPIHSEL